MTVYILGGGPAGLALAHGLSEESEADFALLERGPTLGGLAQTLTWDGCGRHDLGPHKIFTQDAELMVRVEGLLEPEDWLTREKISRIYMNKHFLPYPPSPFSLAKVFGLAPFLRMTTGYAGALLRSLTDHSAPKTFEADLCARMGKPLYEVLFRPIALKLWGEPTNLDVKLSQGRIQTPSLLELAGRLLGLRKKSDFEALTFRYPSGGLQRLWEAIHQKTEERGKFLLLHEVTGIHVAEGRVKSFAIRRRDSGEALDITLGDDDFLVSTLPLGVLGELIGESMSARTRDLIRRTIQLNDLLLVFLRIDRSSLFPESWIFVPDPKVVFHRISEQESFDPAMTPDGSIVCCEIMSNEARPMSALSDEEIVERAVQGLQDMEFSGYQILDKRVIRLPRSYPVFRPGYQEALGEILAELDTIQNFRTVGRQGAFNYIGTLDAMDIGYGCARWLAAHLSKRGSPSWEAERERTSHYPVLD